MNGMRRTSPELTRLLESIDWSRCSGRELHRLAEGAAQAVMRGEGGRPGGAYKLLFIDENINLMPPVIPPKSGMYWDV